MISLFLTVLLTLITVVGLLLNTYILIVVLLTRQISSANNLLLLHLGAVDISLGVIYLIFSIPGVKGTEWSTEGTTCILHGFLYTFLHPLALWTICGLNCDRYYAIAAPLHYSHIVSARKVLVGLAIGWIISITLCLPPLFSVAPYKFISGLGACAPQFSTGSHGTLLYSTLYSAFTLLLPATIIICCNTKILMIARYHRHRIASAIYEVTLSAQVTITHQRNPFFVPTVTAPQTGGPPKFRGRSAIYTVLQLVGSLLLLYVPYYGIILWDATVGNTTQLHENFYVLASSFLVTSLPINGFLYGIKSKTLKKTFQNYWRKKQTKSEVNQEIQARTPSTCGSRRPSLTPLGFFTKPTLQRRLSETLLDVHKAVNKSPHKTKIKRIASELTWRPISANSLNLSPNNIDVGRRKINQTTSCNTLQVPAEAKISSHNMLLQKFFRLEQEKLAKKSHANEGASPKRSPRILITRAFSEESDSTNNSPSKDAMSKKHSTSASTLIERKWRKLCSYKDEEEYDSDGQKTAYTTKPLLDGSNRHSDSSESSCTSTSDSSGDSSGRLYISMGSSSCRNGKSSKSLDVTEAEEASDESLLSFRGSDHPTANNTSNKQNNLILVNNVQSQEVVL